MSELKPCPNCHVKNRYSFRLGENTKEEYEENKKNEKLLADKYFKKAIIMYIDLPKG